MATNPMDYCPDDNDLSCENCVHFKEWTEYGEWFRDCDNLDGQMVYLDEIDPSVANECSQYKEKAND